MVKAADDGAAGSKLYFLSSEHVLSVQDTRIPRVFKDSPSFDGTKAGGRGGKRSGEVGAAPKAVILRALTYEY